MKNQHENTVLSAEQRRELKKLAHHLKPVVILGKKGWTEAVVDEIEEALDAHELIKVQIQPSHKVTLNEDIATILSKTGADHIDTIGNVVILYKKGESEQA